MKSPTVRELHLKTSEILREDPGMRACAGWLKIMVKEVPAKWISAGGLYWRADWRAV